MILYPFGMACNKPCVLLLAEKRFLMELWSNCQNGHAMIVCQIWDVRFFLLLSVLLLSLCDCVSAIVSIKLPFYRYNNSNNKESCRRHDCMSQWNDTHSGNGSSGRWNPWLTLYDVIVFEFPGNGRIYAWNPSKWTIGDAIGLWKSSEGVETSALPLVVVLPFPEKAQQKDDN